MYTKHSTIHVHNIKHNEYTQSHVQCIVDIIWQLFIYRKVVYNHYTGELDRWTGLKINFYENYTCRLIHCKKGKVVLVTSVSYLTEHSGVHSML